MTVVSIDDLRADRVLVVSPHPDDESLGAGGLIARLAGAGCVVHVAFITDGGASHLQSATWPRDRLAGERRREAEAALRELGAGAQPRTFLGLLDAAMPQRGSDGWLAAVRRLVCVVTELRPGLVVLPWRRDPHRDHRDSYRLTADALAEARIHVPTLEYAIWLAEWGAPEDHPRAEEGEAVQLDIAGVRAQKRRAVEAHRTQTTDLVADDPSAFQLSAETIERLTGPLEAYWRSSL